MRIVNGNDELTETSVEVKDKQSKSLFSITANITKTELMIAGKYRNLWKENEFKKIQSLVMGLQSEEMNQHTVSDLYDKIFNDQSDEDYKINLNNVSLDIHATSDNEQIEIRESEIINSGNNITEDINNRQKLKVLANRLSKLNRSNSSPLKLIKSE